LFVLIASTAGPYLTRTSKVERVSIDPAGSELVTIDLNQASDLMQKRCSKCHNLDRVVGASSTLVTFGASAMIRKRQPAPRTTWRWALVRLQDLGSAVPSARRQALRNLSCTAIPQLRNAIDRFVQAYQKTAAPFEWAKAVVHPSAPTQRYSDLCN
jgi:hypothetical protein